MEMKFCPLMPINPQTGHRACEPGDCAWFDSEAGTCAVLAISRSLGWAAGRMDDMLDSGLPIRQ